MSQFQFHLIRCLMLPANVNVLAPAGLRCIVCNKYETYKVDDVVKNPALKSRLDGEWTNVFVDPYPGKHFCKACTPPFCKKAVKHKQARASCSKKNGADSGV